MWKVQPEITENQRAWQRQRERTTPCRYGCGVNLVFLKDLLGRTIPCEARKVITREEDLELMSESGAVTVKVKDERVGWPVHKCSKLTTALINRNIEQQYEEEE